MSSAVLYEVLIILAFVSLLNLYGLDDTTFYIDAYIKDVNRLTISDLPATEREKELLKDLYDVQIFENWQPIVILGID